MIIDDSSPSIVYSGQWVTGGIDQEYNDTTHGSWTKGSKATIAFTGRSIRVYGTIGRDHNNGDPAFAPITMYMIDGHNDSTTMFTGKPGTDILYKRLFYQSPRFSSGQHELVVTLTSSNMNTMWIDYFQVEKSATVSPGLIAGVVVGGTVGIVLLIIIGILLRRISRLKRRGVQYEKVPWKATHTYWPWMSRPPGELTPFGGDPFFDTQPLNGTLRPFSVHYTPYSAESPEPSGSNRTSLTGYAIRGDTIADKTTTRESTPDTSYTSLSGYMTRGGTSADKTGSSLSSSTYPGASSHPNATTHTDHSPRYTVQGTTRAGKINRPSRPRKEQPSSTRTSSNRRPRPSPPETTTTNRVLVEEEDVPPAYSTNPNPH